MLRIPFRASRAPRCSCRHYMIRDPKTGGWKCVIGQHPGR